MTYEDDNKYTSSGVGTAGLTLGVIGTTLASGILGNGGVGGLFGNNSANQQINTLMMENSILKSTKESDEKLNKSLVEVYTELRKQDKEQDAKIASLDTRVTAIEVANPLREQVVLGQVNGVAQNLASSVAALNTSIANTSASLSNSINSRAIGLQAEIDCIQKTLNGITALYVPAAKVTPEPMPLYNTWSSSAT